MPSKRRYWEVYNDEMSEFDSGHALWMPAAVSDSGLIRPGDVGYIRAGCFHWLFYAGLPLGERKEGVDVPRNFKQLPVGKIVERMAPLGASPLCTSGVRTISDPLPSSQPPPLTPSTSTSPPASSLGPASSISFELTGGQGAALLTKFSTYREDVQRVGTFEKYTKEHYASWVAFARETGHGDLNPVLVTGVDRTRDFAMFCYSNDDNDLGCKFTTSGLGAGSDWGTWHKTGLVYTNHGPQSWSPPSSSNSRAEPVSDEYNQYVFIRYYTMRKRLGVPRVIKAGAGPHDLGRRQRESDGSSPEMPCDSGPDSDSGTASGVFDSDVDDGGCSLTSTEAESDIVVHNVVAEGKDDFDVVAEYIFQNSGADSVLLHHQDISMLRNRGGSAALSSLLLETPPSITVDENGVGTVKPTTGDGDPTLCPSIIVGESPSATSDRERDSLGEVEMWHSATLLPVGSAPVATGYAEPERPRRRKRPRTPRTPSGGYETGDRSTSPASFSHQGHASPSEPPTAVGRQETYLYDWTTLDDPTSGRAQADTADGIAETIIPATTTQPPIPTSCSPTQDWRMQTSPHWSAGVYPPFSQYAVHFGSILHHGVVTFDHADSDVFGRNLPSRASPHTSNDQTEETQGFPDYGGVFPPYLAAIGSLSSEKATQTSQVVTTRETSPVGTASLVSGLPFEMGSEETARPPVGLSQSGINDNSKNPKKRNSEATTQDEPRKVKRTRYSAQRPSDLQGIIQLTPLPLIGRPDLRLLRQVEYSSSLSQLSWVKLPDIYFSVGGKDGINFMDARNAGFDGPDGRDDLMFTDGNVGGSISCRMIFEGYQAPRRTRQIATMNYRGERSRITRKKLAQSVANHVLAYLEELTAAGTPYPVCLEDMFLTKLTQVARASWQPQIWYRVTPSSSAST